MVGPNDSNLLVPRTSPSLFIAGELYIMGNQTLQGVKINLVMKRLQILNTLGVENFAVINFHRYKFS